MKSYVPAFLIFFYFISDAAAQSFEKHAKFIDLGIGIGIYNTKGTNSIDDSTHKDKAASVIIPLSFEYGIGNRVGVGAQVVADIFFTERDSISNTTPDANSVEFAVFGNYHVVKTDHVDLFAGLTAGFSSFTYHANNTYNATLKGGGSFFDIHAGARFLFGKHFGMIASLRFPSFAFTETNVEDDIGTLFSYDLRLNGFVIGTGFTYKL
jgi:hypothetical protein